LSNRNKLRIQIENFAEQIKETTFQATLDEIKELKQEVEKLEKELVDGKERSKRLSDEVASLKREMEDFEREKERKTKEMKEQIKKEKIALKQQKATVKTLKEAKRTLELRISSAEKDVADNTAKKEDLEKEIVNCQKSYDECKKKLDEQQAAHDTLVKNYDEEHQKLMNQNQAVTKLREEISKLEDALDKLEGTIKAKDRELRRLIEIRKNAREKVLKMKNDHPWIVEEEKNFGKEGGNFDFTKYPQNEYPSFEEYIRSQCIKHKETVEKLGTKVNKQVTSQFERHNAEAKELRNKKNGVERDRQMLLNIIKDLEEKKKKAVQDVYEKVNEHFNQIFGRLLPGTKAKLQPLENKTIHEGLEIRVAFGDEWRDSLSELSGGQKFVSLLVMNGGIH